MRGSYTHEAGAASAVGGIAARNQCVRRMHRREEGFYDPSGYF